MGRIRPDSGPISSFLRSEITLFSKGLRTTARRVYENNPRLKSFEIGQAIDSYVTYLRASAELEMDLNIFRMNRIISPRKDWEEIRCHTKDGIEAFSDNATIGNSAKCRLVKRFHSPLSS